MRRAEERQLIQQAQAGDQNAFTQLYRAYVQDIYRYVYQRVSDVHIAEDITGDVFLRAVEGLPTYEDRGQTWLAWLYRIAHARVVDYYRKRDRRPVDNDLDATPIATEEDIDAPLMQETIRQAIRNVLHELTDEQREVILLRFIEAHPIETVARIMGKNPNAIKALQHRALKAMATRLERAGFDAHSILAGLS